MSNNPLFASPIPVSRPYRPIGRRLLAVVDPQPELPYENESDRYESQFIYYRDVCGRSLVASKNNAPKVRFADSDLEDGNILPSVFELEGDLENVVKISHCQQVITESVVIPRFYIYSTPYVTKKDLECLPIPILERAKERSKDSIWRTEDVEIFKALNMAVPADHSWEVVGKALPENLLWMFSIIEEHELDVEHILIHPQRLRDFRSWGKVEGLHLYSRAERNLTGIWGTFHSAKILCTTMIPKNAIYGLAAPEFVGYFIEEEKLSTRSVKYTNGSEGAILAEKIGIAVLNDYTIGRILITAGKKG